MPSLSSKSAPPAAATSLRFVGCEIWPAERRLLIGGRPSSLSGRAFDVLCVLAAAHERPVPKGELLDAVWPGQDVEEGNLAVHISALRKLLGPQAIATVPGCGYRFAMPLHEGAALADAAPSLAQALGAGGRPAPWATGGAPLGTTVVAAAPLAHPALSNLPHHLPALIGRDATRRGLTESLGSAVLLSVVGPGGIGKTLLARSLAADQARLTEARANPRFPDGVWWVDLADLNDGADVVTRLALTIGLPLNHSIRPLDSLIKGLQRQKMLLVLDNCEHLVEDVASLVQTLMQQSAGLGWLVTSQEPLKLPMEQVFRLDTLAVPPPGTPLAQALGHGAVALLAERARASDRHFALTEANIAAAIDLCTQLDGIALAIEMAAARLPWLGLDGVRSRLDERLRLLAADSRSAPARHRTLHAALDWSHELLSPTEQTVFRRLAVFRGGFTLELAQTVVAGPAGVPTDPPGLDAWEVIDTLGTLVDKSLVQVDWRPQAQAPRYRLLESTRLFADQRLAASGEAPALARRHAQAMADFSLEALRQVWHQRDGDWLPQHEPEQHNLRAALAWAARERHAPVASAVYQLLVVITNMLGGGTDARRWVPEMLSLADEAEPEDRARLLLNLGSTFRNIAPPQSAEHFRAAAQVYRQLGDAPGLARCVAGEAIALARLGQIEAAQLLVQEVCALVRPDWPARLRVVAEEACGMLALFQSRPADALAHYLRLRDGLMDAGSEGGLAAVAVNLTAIALAMGQPQEAARVGRAHVAMLRRTRNLYMLACVLGNLCTALVQTGELDDAEAAGREALPLLRDEESAVLVFDPLAQLAALRGRLDVAAALIGYADASREASTNARDPVDEGARNQAWSRVLAGLGAEDAARWLAHGRSLSNEQADALAFAHSVPT